MWWPKAEEHQGEGEHAWCPRCASSENHWADWSYHSTILDIEAVMSEYWRAPTGGAVVPGTLSRKHIQAASRRRHPRQAYHRLRPKKGSQPWRRRWLSFDAELPSWRSTPRARPLVQDSHGLGRGLWTKLRLEVLTASRQERYPAHGLWSGLARPGVRIPTASDQGSHGLWPGYTESTEPR